MGEALETKAINRERAIREEAKIKMQGEMTRKKMIN